MRYATVLLNLPYEASYSYIVPPSLASDAVFGVRVVVPFGRRRMTGFVISVSDVRPSGDYELKAIEFIAEDELVEVTPKNIRLRKKILDTKTRERQARRSAQAE